MPEVMAAMDRLYKKQKTDGRFAPHKMYDDRIDQHRMAIDPDKIENLHASQSRRNWTQPSEEFKEWWKHHRNAEIKPVIAWNCEHYRQEFLESREYGAA